MKSVETETYAEIADAIKFYEPEFINSPSNYESSSYETCEKAAFDLKFGRDKWKIRFKDEEALIIREPPDWSYMLNQSKPSVMVFGAWWTTDGEAVEDVMSWIGDGAC